MNVCYFPIVPLCEKQLRDVHPEDVVTAHLVPYEANGDYRHIPLARTCRIENAGGGYDKFRSIYYDLTGKDTGPEHFIVQLYGCTRDCPWCYVTPAGVWSDAVGLTPREMVILARGWHEARIRRAINALDKRDKDYETKKTELSLLEGYQVFHLMGGAPALYLNQWPTLANEVVRGGYIFHSDFLLDEGLYNEHVLTMLNNICGDKHLHAVSFKPRSPLSRLQLANLKTLIATKVPFYITFTGMGAEEIVARKKQVTDAGIPASVFDTSFVFPLKHYKSLDA